MKLLSPFETTNSVISIKLTHTIKIQVNTKTRHSDRYACDYIESLCCDGILLAIGTLKPFSSFSFGQN